MKDFKFWLISAAVILSVCSTCTANPIQAKNCQPLSEATLKYMLGKQFNPRYMRQEKPLIMREEIFEGIGVKRGIYHHNTGEDFFFDKSASATVSLIPAWEEVLMPEQKQTQQSRAKRQVQDNRHNQYDRKAEYAKEWHCKSELNWKFIGDNYFPRYLRNLECIGSSCWYSLFQCKANAFAVTVLKKREGYCTSGEKLEKFGIDPLKPVDLWVFEEQPVNFCCKCELDLSRIKSSKQQTSSYIPSAYSQSSYYRKPTQESSRRRSGAIF